MPSLIHNCEVNYANNGLYTDFLFYNSEDGKIKVQVIADPETETIWTSQKGMSEIFGVDVPAISKHLKNIFEVGELQESSTVSKMEIVQMEGERSVKRIKEFYRIAFRLFDK